MSKSDSLFKLIHSLSRTEKSYFKKMAVAFSDAENNKTVQLFDIIEKQREYDEDGIAKEINDKDFVRNLSRNKNYLFEQLLHSQYNYHLKWSKTNEIAHATRCVELLIEKQLFKEAYKQVRSLKKEAYYYEAYVQLYTLINMERAIPSALYANDADANKMLAEQQSILKILNNVVQYDTLIRRANELWGKISETKEKKNSDDLKEMLKHPLLKSENEAFTIGAKANYNIIQGGSYFVLGKFKNCYPHSQRSVQLFEENKQLIKIYPQGYMRVVFNLFITQAELLKFAQMFETMKRFFVFAEEPVIKKSKYFQARIFEFTNYLSITFYTRIGEFKKSLERCEYVNKNLSDFDIQTNYQLLLNYEMAYCYFITENYKGALRCLNKIIFSASTFNPSSLHFARFLSIITHFELGNHTVIKSQLKTFGEDFKSIDNNGKLLINFMESDSKNVFKPSKLEKEFKKLHKDIINFVEKDETYKKWVDQLDVVSWLESKINKKPMRDIMKEKALKKYGKINLPE